MHRGRLLREQSAGLVQFGAGRVELVLVEAKSRVPTMSGGTAGIL